jgi:hypothetical protein
MIKPSPFGGARARNGQVQEREAAADIRFSSFFNPQPLQP